MFSTLVTWLTVLLFMLVFSLVLVMKKMLQVCGREDDTSSLNSSQNSIIPEIFVIHNVGGPGPYEMIDPMNSNYIDPIMDLNYMDNLAPPLYQREESRPSQSSQEKPPIYQITPD